MQVALCFQTATQGYMSWTWEVSTLSPARPSAAGVHAQQLSSHIAPEGAAPLLRRECEHLGPQPVQLGGGQGGEVDSSCKLLCVTKL